MKYYIDARSIENEEVDFLTLGLWGKTCPEYVIDTIFQIDNVSELIVLTDNRYLMHIINTKYPEVRFEQEFSENEVCCLINARCPLIKRDTVLKMINNYQINGDCISCGTMVASCGWNDNCIVRLPIIFTGNINNLNSECDYVYLSEEEQVIVNNRNSFELALVLLNKRNKSVWLSEQIHNRITEKECVLLGTQKNDICLIGHSQIDQWDIGNIGGHSVQNCGISGISSFEYNELILETNMLKTNANIIVMMHGTNDIVYNKTIEEITSSINENILFFKKNYSYAKLFFIKCLHVNGRLDRSNSRIDALNESLTRKLNGITLIDTDAFDDEYGNLRAEYTRDGLHLSNAGYEVLNKLICEAIKDE